jgi:cytochrome P450
MRQRQVQTSALHVFSLAANISSRSLATLTWTLVELCRDPALQKRVRAELLEAFPIEDPTYEELTSVLPLFDAVIHEVLRLHPPLDEAWRTVCCPSPFHVPATMNHDAWT